MFLNFGISNLIRIAPPAAAPASSLLPIFILLVATTVVAQVQAGESIPRTTERSIVDVTDFDAAGDDTRDDTKALKQAVAALRPAKGVDTLYFPPGTYLTKEPLRLPGGIDVVGIQAILKASDVPAIELAGDVDGISFWGLELDGGPPAAVHQHGGKAKHIYFQRCNINGPSETCYLPDQEMYRRWLTVHAELWEGRPSHGILFTDVEDSTVIGGSFTAGIAGIAVEGRMRNLAVLRTIVTHAPNLVGFFFDTTEDSSCLLLNNTVHCNMGYVIQAPKVSNLTMRGMSTEANGVALLPDMAFEPMFDIRGGANVALEMINLAPLSWRKDEDRKWDGSQIRLNGTNHRVAGCFLIEPGNAENPSLDSDDPRLTVWGTDFPTARLNLSGPSELRRILASKFEEGNHADEFRTAETTHYLNLERPTSSGLEADRNSEPDLWGPPARRFLWGELGLRSVRDYGATGDGETDDTAAFKEALAEGGILYVPEGTYLITSPIHPEIRSGRYPRFVLLGAGQDRSILKTKDHHAPLIDFPWRGKTALNGKPGEIAYDFYAEGCTLMDLTLQGGSHGVRVEPNTANWLVDSVTFRAQTVAGFAADSFDNGNILVNCRFEGADYGFVAGGWNRRFVDKTFLWKCIFENQDIHGVMIGSAKNAKGDRPNGLWMHTVLRDCIIRSSGEAGVVMMSTTGRPNFLDHCLIENCGRKAGGPYVEFVKGGGSCAAAYQTTIRRTSGPPAHPLLSVREYTWARFQDVRVSGAQGETAVAIDTPYCWLENVSADGPLQTPGGSEIKAYETAVSDQAPPSVIGRSRFVEDCRFRPR